jgi:NAD(P)-dependent dehydrogenase (short-subunit alcohol dehydrogenase family)
MDFMFWLFCVLFCGLFVCYVIAYILHGWPIDCPSNARLDGKTVLITGGSSGIGYETAVELARRGARIIIASRQQDKGQQAIRSIIDKTGNKQVYYEPLDLCDWLSVRRLTNHICATESHLDILINNAGIAASEFGFRNRQGYDHVFAVNYLGHFLLVYQLLPLLRRSAPSRILSVTSIAHSFFREPLFDINSAIDGSAFCRRLNGYDASKFAMVLHTKELARQLGGTGVTANCLHPGAVYTDLWLQTVPNFPVYLQRLIRLLMRPIFMSPRAGAQTTVYCAVAEELSSVSGKYFRRCRMSRESVRACDVQMASQLWHVSMLLTGCTTTGRDVQLSRNEDITNTTFADEDVNESGNGWPKRVAACPHTGLSIERG